MKKHLFSLMVAGALAACSNTPPAPDWQMNAKASAERATQAWLTGEQRVEAAEFARAQREVAATGRPDLAAQVELLRCAARVAALELGPCTGFDALAADATAAQQAYARYLASLSGTADVALLPEVHRPLAAGSASPDATLAAIAECNPTTLEDLQGFQRGQATPGVIGQAIDTASAQGWRRPLLAWLKVQQARAQGAGSSDELGRIQRRIDLIAPSTR